MFSLNKNSDNKNSDFFFLNFIEPKLYTWAVMGKQSGFDFLPLRCAQSRLKNLAAESTELVRHFLTCARMSTVMIMRLWRNQAGWFLTIIDQIITCRIVNVFVNANEILFNGWINEKSVPVESQHPEY